MSGVADRAGARRAEELRVEIVAVMAREVPRLAVTVEGDAVVVAGRGLRWQAVHEPALRWIGSLLR